MDRPVIGPARPGVRPVDNTLGNVALAIGLLSLVMPYGLGMVVAAGAVVAAIFAFQHAATGRSNRVARESAIGGLAAASATLVLQLVLRDGPLWWLIAQ